MNYNNDNGDDASAAEALAASSAVEVWIQDTKYGSSSSFSLDNKSINTRTSKDGEDTGSLDGAAKKALLNLLSPKAEYLQPQQPFYPNPSPQQQVQVQEEEYEDSSLGDSTYAHYKKEFIDEFLLSSNQHQQQRSSNTIVTDEVSSYSSIDDHYRVYREYNVANNNDNDDDEDLFSPLSMPEGQKRDMDKTPLTKNERKKHKQRRSEKRRERAVKSPIQIALSSSLSSFSSSFSSFPNSASNPFLASLILQQQQQQQKEEEEDQVMLNRPINSSSLSSFGVVEGAVKKEKKSDDECSSSSNSTLDALMDKYFPEEECVGNDADFDVNILPKEQPQNTEEENSTEEESDGEDTKEGKKVEVSNGWGIWTSMQSFSFYSENGDDNDDNDGEKGENVPMKNKRKKRRKKKLKKKKKKRHNNNDDDDDDNDNEKGQVESRHSPLNELEESETSQESETPKVITTTTTTTRGIALPENNEATSTMPVEPIRSSTPTPTAPLPSPAKIPPWYTDFNTSLPPTTTATASGAAPAASTSFHPYQAKPQNPLDSSWHDQLCAAAYDQQHRQQYPPTPPHQQQQEQQQQGHQEESIPTSSISNKKGKSESVWVSEARKRYRQKYLKSYSYAPPPPTHYYAPNATTAAVYPPPPPPSPLHTSHPHPHEQHLPPLNIQPRMHNHATTTTTNNAPTSLSSAISTTVHGITSWIHSQSQPAPPQQLPPLLQEPTQSYDSDLADAELTYRAKIIQEEIRHTELEELAIEAEKAAEAGIEKFVGNPSTFGISSNHEIGSGSNGNNEGGGDDVDDKEKRKKGEVPIVPLVGVVIGQQQQQQHDEKEKETQQQQYPSTPVCDFSPDHQGCWSPNSNNHQGYSSPNDVNSLTFDANSFVQEDDDDLLHTTPLVASPGGDKNKSQYRDIYEGGTNHSALWSPSSPLTAAQPSPLSNHSPFDSKKMFMTRHASVGAFPLAPPSSPQRYHYHHQSSAPGTPLSKVSALSKIKARVSSAPATLSNNSSHGVVGTGLQSSSHRHNNAPKKKIKVMALRQVSEVIPGFIFMHNCLRSHLCRGGVETDVLLLDRRRWMDVDNNDAKRSVDGVTDKVDGNDDVNGRSNNDNEEFVCSKSNEDARSKEEHKHGENVSSTTEQNSFGGNNIGRPTSPTESLHLMAVSGLKNIAKAVGAVPPSPDKNTIQQQQQRRRQKYRRSTPNKLKGEKCGFMNSAPDADDHKINKEEEEDKEMTGLESSFALPKSVDDDADNVVELGIMQSLSSCGGNDFLDMGNLIHSYSLTSQEGDDDNNDCGGKVEDDGKNGVAVPTEEVDDDTNFSLSEDDNEDEDGSSLEIEEEKLFNLLSEHMAMPPVTTTTSSKKSGSPRKKYCFTSTPPTVTMTRQISTSTPRSQHSASSSPMTPLMLPPLLSPSPPREEQFLRSMNHLENRFGLGGGTTTSSVGRGISPSSSFHNYDSIASTPTRNGSGKNQPHLIRSSNVTMVGGGKALFRGIQSTTAACSTGAVDSATTTPPLGGEGRKQIIEFNDDGIGGMDVAEGATGILGSSKQQHSLPPTPDGPSTLGDTGSIHKPGAFYSSQQRQCSVATNITTIDWDSPSPMTVRKTLSSPSPLQHPHPSPSDSKQQQQQPPLWNTPPTNLQTNNPNSRSSFLPPLSSPGRHGSSSTAPLLPPTTTKNGNNINLQSFQKTPPPAMSRDVSVDWDSPDWSSRAKKKKYLKGVTAATYSSFSPLGPAGGGCTTNDDDNDDQENDVVVSHSDDKKDGVATFAGSSASVDTEEDEQTSSSKKPKQCLMTELDTPTRQTMTLLIIGGGNSNRSSPRTPPILPPPPLSLSITPSSSPTRPKQSRQKKLKKKKAVTNEVRQEEEQRESFDFMKKKGFENTKQDVEQEEEERIALSHESATKTPSMTTNNDNDEDDLVSSLPNKQPATILLVPPPLSYESSTCEDDDNNNNKNNEEEEEEKGIEVSTNSSQEEQATPVVPIPQKEADVIQDDVKKSVYVENPSKHDDAITTTIATGQKANLSNKTSSFEKKNDPISSTAHDDEEKKSTDGEDQISSTGLLLCNCPTHALPIVTHQDGVVSPEDDEEEEVSMWNRDETHEPSAYPYTFSSLADCDNSGGLECEIRDATDCEIRDSGDAIMGPSSSLIKVKNMASGAVQLPSSSIGEEFRSNDNNFKKEIHQKERIGARKAINGSGTIQQDQNELRSLWVQTRDSYLQDCGINSTNSTSTKQIDEERQVVDHLVAGSTSHFQLSTMAQDDGGSDRSSIPKLAWEEPEIPTSTQQLSNGKLTSAELIVSPMVLPPIPPDQRDFSKKYGRNICGEFRSREPKTLTDPLSQSLHIEKRGCSANTGSKTCVAGSSAISRSLSCPNLFYNGTDHHESQAHAYNKSPANKNSSMAGELFIPSDISVHSYGSVSSDEALEKVVQSFWLRYGCLDKGTNNETIAVVKDDCPGDCMIDVKKESSGFIHESAKIPHIGATENTSIPPTTIESSSKVDFSLSPKAIEPNNLDAGYESPRSGRRESNVSKITLVMSSPKGNADLRSTMDNKTHTSGRTRSTSRSNIGKKSKRKSASEKSERPQSPFSAALRPMAEFLGKMSSYTGKRSTDEPKNKKSLLMRNEEDVLFVSNYMYSTPQVLLDPPRSTSKVNLDRPRSRSLCDVTYTPEIQCVEAVSGCSGFSFAFDSAVDLLPKQNSEKPALAVAIGGRSCEEKSTWLQSTIRRLRKPRTEELKSGRGRVFKPPSLQMKKANPDSSTFALFSDEASGPANKREEQFSPVAELDSKAHTQKIHQTKGSSKRFGSTLKTSPYNFHQTYRKSKSFGPEMNRSRTSRKGKRNEKTRTLLSNRSLLSNSESECETE